MRRLLKPAILCLIGFILWGWYDPFRFAKQAIIPGEPVQAETKAAPFSYRSLGLLPRNFLIEPRATYDITGRVLHKKFYFTHNFFGDLIPYDIAIGWKGMSDLNMLRPYMSFDHIGASGLGRYYTYKYHWRGEDPPPEYVAAMADNSNKANNHTIPANYEIFRKLWSINTGDIVRLQGYLVDVEWPEHAGWKWTTSLSRTEGHAYKWGDNNPDCETIFVTDVTIY